MARDAHRRARAGGLQTILTALDCFGVSEESVATIERQLPEAPPTLFRPVLAPALNALTLAYWRWLETSEGQQAAISMIGFMPRWSMAPGQQTPVPELSSTADYLSGW